MLFIKCPWHALIVISLASHTETYWETSLVKRVWYLVHSQTFYFATKCIEPLQWGMTTFLW